MKPRPYVIGPAQERILRALGLYYYLTARQITTLLYKAGSMTGVQAHMKDMATHGYVLITKLPVIEGKPPNVYSLTAEGVHALAECGVVPQGRVKPGEHRTHWGLSHTLAVNDFLIAAQKIESLTPRIRITQVVHERDLKRNPCWVTMPDGTKVSLLPDAWIDLRIDRQYQLCFSLELDRGTEFQTAWRRKVRALLAWEKTSYVQRFKTKALTILVLVHGDFDLEKRVENLVHWTEEEITQQGARKQIDLFRFGTAAGMTPDRLFFSPMWRRPLDTTYYTLLAGIPAPAL